VTSSLAIPDALLAGFGLSLVPRIYVEDDLTSGRLRTTLDDWDAMQASVFAVFSSRRYPNAKVRAFIDFFVEELGQCQHRS